MIELKTSEGITNVKAKGDVQTILADLGVIAAAVLTAVLRDADEESIDYYCNAANMSLLHSVQRARERVKNHE